MDATETEKKPLILLPASFGRRVVAFMLDSFIISIIASIVYTFSLSGWAWLIASWLYYALSESGRYQATLGKRAMSLIVTTEDYETPSFARASGRFFGMFLSYLTFGFGFLMAAFTRRHQALHDIMAECYVIRIK